MSYKITNIEYGYGPLASPAIYGDVGFPKPDVIETQIFSFTLVQGNGKNILVDSGINISNPEKAGLWESVGQSILGTEWALEQIGMAPEEVDIVIMTHSHMDHIGGVELFPNAQIYLQKKDFEAWESMCADPRYMQLTLPAVMACDFKIVREIAAEGRVSFLDGNIENLLPGISIHAFHDCHSVVDSIVAVEADEGEYLLCGDLALRPANLLGTDEWPGFLAPTTGLSGSKINVFRSYKWMLDRVDGDISRIIMAHDNTKAKRYKSEPTEQGLAIHYIA